MALNNLGLGLVFTAEDLASGTVMRLERNFTSLARRVGIDTDKITGAFKEFGVGLSIMAVGAGTVFAGVSLANEAGQFERSVAAVGAISGATTEELAALHDAALAVGTRGYAPTEATVGLQELAAAGYSARESIDLLTPVINLAAGSLGQLGFGEAAGVASQALKAFGIPTRQAGEAVDQMLMAVNAFALSANELPMALGNASRGAQALKQSLSETLISFGLVKNIIPGVERAATGVAVAMERMANPEVQAALHGIGVSVTDSGGKFRNFLDIIGDMLPALTRMTDAKRAAFLIDTFGAHALGAVQAIMTQVTNGIKTNTGETVAGAAAIAYLRDQFQNAGGTAEDFANRMFDTWEGQKQVLGGILKTLTIVLGEPFAELFKPVVKAIADVFKAVLAVVRGISPSVKKAFASFLVVAGSILAVVGAAIAAKAAFVLFALGLKIAGVTIGGLLAVLLPAIVLVGALALAAWGLYIAFRDNVGRTGEFFGRLWDQVSLFFRGIVQLFRDGGFSGAVRQELNKAENAGVKDFLITLVLWAYRAKNFLMGVADGFSAGVQAARPTIIAFLDSLRRLGAALGFLGKRDDADTARDKFQAFGVAGAKVGETLGKVFDFVLQVFTAVVDVSRGLVSTWGGIKVAAGFLFSAIMQVGTQLGEMIDRLSGNTRATRENGSAWEWLGKAIGAVLIAVVGAIGWIVWGISATIAVVDGVLGALGSVVGGIVDILSGLLHFVNGAFSGEWSETWLGIKLIVFGVIDGITGAIFELIGAIAGAMESIGRIFGAQTNWQKGLQGMKDQFHRDMGQAFGLEGHTFVPVASAGGPGAPGTPAPAPLGPMPAVAATKDPPWYERRSDTSNVASAQTPTIVNVQVDGQTIARAVHNADAEASQRGSSPLPSY